MSLSTLRAGVTGIVGVMPMVAANDDAGAGGGQHCRHHRSWWRCVVATTLKVRVVSVYDAVGEC